MSESRAIAEIKRDIRNTRKEMRAAGIRRTSCFNGGMSGESYRYNARMFALETELRRAEGGDAMTFDTLHLQRLAQLIDEIAGPNRDPIELDRAASVTGGMHSLMDMESRGLVAWVPGGIIIPTPGVSHPKRRWDEASDAWVWE